MKLRCLYFAVVFALAGCSGGTVTPPPPPVVTTSRLTFVWDVDTSLPACPSPTVCMQQYALGDKQTGLPVATLQVSALTIVTNNGKKQYSYTTATALPIADMYALTAVSSDPATGKTYSSGVAYTLITK